MNPRHRILGQEEFRSFWAYWNHGHACEWCHPLLCEVGMQLRDFWKEAVDVLNSYEDGSLKWLNQSSRQRANFCII